MYQPYNPTWVNPYQQQLTPAQPLQAPFNGITKVKDKNSAMQRVLPPNSTSEAMFDYDGKTFYVVSTDGTGAKTIETFDYSPHIEKPVTIDGAQFVSREEFDNYVAKTNAALGALNDIRTTVSNTSSTTSKPKKSSSRKS